MPYDDAGRLKTITQGAETFTYSYDKLSRVERLERPNGVKTEYQYDEVNRLKRLAHTNAMGVALEDFHNSFNADDEIEAIQSLASATLLPASKSVSQANAANRIAQFGQAGLSFDNEGQTTNRTDDRGTAVYEWDARGRLKKVTMPNSPTISYDYDAIGRRKRRTNGQITTDFIYDGSEVVLDQVGDSIINYLNGFGFDEKLRQTNEGVGPFYFLQDYLGSTSALVNRSGNLIERGYYEAFGASTGSSLTRYGFTGRELDLSAKLVYYRARWYEPQQGRFLREDPIGLRGGINLYIYVRANPILYRDPLGLDAEMCHRRMLIPAPYARHCFVRFNKDNGDTLSYDPDGVHPDPNPKPGACTPIKGKQNDDCLRKEMMKCQGGQYDFTGFNCCHCVEEAMKACGLSIPIEDWPNWPVNPGPQPGEVGYKP